MPWTIQQMVKGLLVKKTRHLPALEDKASS